MDPGNWCGESIITHAIHNNSVDLLCNKSVLPVPKSLQCKMQQNCLNYPNLQVCQISDKIGQHKNVEIFTSHNISDFQLPLLLILDTIML